MTQRITNVHKKKSQNNRQGDWICLLCNNYNYSFRVNCNRCQIQTRDSNHPVSIVYYENNYYMNQNKFMMKPNLYQYSSHDRSDFPTVVFLSLNNDPWDLYREETNPRKDLNQSQNTLWINRLIED